MATMVEKADSLEADFKVLCSEYERRRSSSATVHRFGALKAFVTHELGVARKAAEDFKFQEFSKSEAMLIRKLQELYDLCYGRR